MKKRILLIVVTSFMIMGAVSAAGVWGTYKGNQIIRLTVNGQQVKVNDVPAISYNGRTMIPIYLLKEAGVNYEWDSKNQTVNILKDENNEKKSEKKSDLDVSTLIRDVQSQRQFIRLMDQLELLSACIEIVDNTVTNEQIKKANEQLIKLNPEYMRLFLNKDFIENKVYSDVINEIEKGKNNLYEWNTNGARSNYIAGKTLLNSLYSGLDDRITKHMGTLYSELNK